MKTATRVLICSLVIPLVILFFFLFAFENALTPRVTPPLDQNALWVSADPNIWFVVFDEETGEAVGELISEGKTIEIMMGWGPGRRFEIWRFPGDKADDILVRGSCKFSENEGTVHVLDDVAEILNGAKTITFLRYEKEEVRRTGLEDKGADFSSDLS